MTDCVQFFSSEGTRVEKFPIFAPQYKVVQFFDGRYKWYRLTKDCQYEEQGEGSYQAVLYELLVDCRRVNAKKLKLNWNTHPDLLDASVVYEHELKDGDDGTTMYLTVDNKPCQTLAVAAWKIVKEGQGWYAVYRQLDKGVWVQVFEENLYTCRQFLSNQLEGVRERLIELYRSNRGMGLYRFVATLNNLNTVSILGDTTLAEVVEGAINYTSSWTSKAIRVGSKCIVRDGTKSCIPRPTGTMPDWNVTQLTHLSRLEIGEIQFLVNKNLVTPVMSGDEVWEVVKDYLTDPDRKLMREYHTSREEGLVQ